MFVSYIKMYKISTKTMLDYKLSADYVWQQETTANMIDFYKETHWSARKEKFNNATSEHNYVRLIFL